ncbi:hypothetical protein L1887_22971 [Cichorium endivia]|nr:hypothetical protein L1887_22971 [Cichorium endivia]
MIEKLRLAVFPVNSFLHAPGEMMRGFSDVELDSKTLCFALCVSSGNAGCCVGRWLENNVADRVECPVVGDEGLAGEDDVVGKECVARAKGLARDGVLSEQIAASGKLSVGKMKNNEVPVLNC